MIWNFVLQHMKDVKKKIWRRRGPAVLVLCLAVIVQGCAGYPADKDGGHREQNKTNENGRLSVVTTIFPPYDFVREIAGDCVDLKMLLKPGEESHSYEPTPQDMIAIENSDVFIYVGGENDVWVEDILSSMPDKDRVSIRLLDCVETEEEEHVEGMKEPAGDSHHEMHGEEEHEGSVHEIDEHVWTSPVNASPARPTTRATSSPSMVPPVTSTTASSPRSTPPSAASSAASWLGPTSIAAWASARTPITRTTPSRP